MFSSCNYNDHKVAFKISTFSMEIFEDIKVIIKSHKIDGQTIKWPEEKRKKTNNDVQNITQKFKDWLTLSPQISWVNSGARIIKHSRWRAKLKESEVLNQRRTDNILAKRNKKMKIQSTKHYIEN